MESERVIRELFEQNRESQIDLLVIKEALALLISRLIASGAVDQGFLDDLIVCAEGLDCGRGAEIAHSAPHDLSDELHAVQHETRTARATFFTFVERLTGAFRR